MLAIISLICVVVGVAVCKPPIQTPYGNFSTDPLSPEDYERLRNLNSKRAIAALPANFKIMWVNQAMNIVDNPNRPAGNWIQITGSPQSNRDAVRKAAQEIGKLMHSAPEHVFNGVANGRDSGVGIFTSQEKITIYPEFSNLADTPACRGRCDGTCSHTCTFDGRKFQDIAGVTSTRSIVLQDNVLCTPNEPYHQHDNILIHEFGHSVQFYGMDGSEKSQLTAAYNNAKAHNIWTANSYAMANEAEYFAEGTGAYFLVNLQGTTGGMTNCPGHTCANLNEERNFMRGRDPQLYNLLTHIYLNGNPNINNGLSVCS